MLSSWSSRLGAGCAVFMLASACSDNPAADSQVRADRASATAGTHFVYKVADGNGADLCDRRVHSVFRAASAGHLSQQAVAAKQQLAESVAYTSGRYNASCALASGWTTLIDSENFAVHREAAKGPSETATLAVAREALKSLESDSVIDGSQLDWQNARYANVEARGGEGFGKPEVGPFHVQTRITVPRKLNGLPVAGNGVKISVDANLKVVGVQLFWRALEKVAATAPLLGTLDSALAEVQRAHFITTQQVGRKGLAYVDSGIRNKQAYLEPWYTFETQARQHDKRQLRLVPAIAAMRSPAVRTQVEGIATGAGSTR